MLNTGLTIVYGDGLQSSLYVIYALGIDYINCILFISRVKSLEELYKKKPDNAIQAQIASIKQNRRELTHTDLFPYQHSRWGWKFQHYLSYALCRSVLSHQKFVS